MHSIISKCIFSWLSSAETQHISDAIFSTLSSQHCIGSVSLDMKMKNHCCNIKRRKYKNTIPRTTTAESCSRLKCKGNLWFKDFEMDFSISGKKWNDVWSAKFGPNHQRFALDWLHMALWSHFDWMSFLRFPIQKGVVAILKFN